MPSSSAKEELLYAEKSCPYAKGNVLKLQHLDKSHKTIEVKVVKAFKFTLSCVMVVEKTEPDKTGQHYAVVKLYDRRFSSLSRFYCNKVYWNDKHENDYINFVRSGGAAEFVKRLDDEDEAEDHSTYSSVENETCMARSCLFTLEDETEVYNALKKHQGSKIPKLHRTVRLYEPSSMPKDKDKFSKQQRDLVDIKGLLLEYIPGPTFQDLANPKESDVPQTAWQPLVDQAIRLPDIFTKPLLLNRDIQPRNIIATKDDNAKGGYRPVMIDLAACDFRTKEHGSDFDWGRLKHDWNEEGKIGTKMLDFLWNQASFRLQYKATQPFAKFALPPAGETQQDLDKKRKEMKFP